MSNTPTSTYRNILSCVFIFLFPCLQTLAAQRDTAKTTTFRFKTVVIDAGHGGKDPGAPGSYSVEKNITLAIAKKLRRVLTEEMPSLNIIMTRNDDTFIPLSRRSEIANENHGNLFVSIHCNSSPAGTGASHKGAEILVYGLHRSKEQFEAIRENASISYEKDYKTKYAAYDENNPANQIILNLYMQKYRKQSIIFGEMLSKNFIELDDRKSMGVKEQGVLVLAHSAMPAVLIEPAYINNHDEEDYLNSEAGQDAIVRDIVSAIKSYKKQLSS